jgi:hypothetical protein
MVRVLNRNILSLVVHFLFRGTVSMQTRYFSLLIYYENFSMDRLLNIQLDEDMIAHDMRTDQLILQTDDIIEAEEAEEEIHNQNETDQNSISDN